MRSIRHEDDFNDPAAEWLTEEFRARQSVRTEYVCECVDETYESETLCECARVSEDQTANESDRFAKAVLIRDLSLGVKQYDICIAQTHSAGKLTHLAIAANP